MRPHDRLGGNIAAGARAVFNDEWLTTALRQPLTDQPREDITGPPGGKPTIKRTGRDG